MTTIIDEEEPDGFINYMLSLLIVIKNKLVRIRILDTTDRFTLCRTNII